MAIDPTLATLFLANLIVLAAALVQTTTGFGYALVAMPMLALVDTAFVPGPALLVAVALTIPMFWADRSHVIPREIALMLPTLLIGTGLGAFLLMGVGPGALDGVFGIAILLGVALTLLAGSIPINGLTLSAGGLAAGVMGTVAGIHGPPLAILFQRVAIERTRATMAALFLIAYLLSLGALSLAGRFTVSGGGLAAALLPGLAAGFAIGRIGAPKLPLRLVRGAILAMATAGAFGLLWRSLG